MPLYFLNLKIIIIHIALNYWDVRSFILILSLCHICDHFNNLSTGNYTGITIKANIPFAP